MCKEEVDSSNKNLQDGLWLERYGELVNFCEKNGHCLVPSDYDANPKLGNWVRTQRAQFKLYKERKPCNMTKERMEMLEKLNFQWKMRGDWMKRFAELRDYYRNHGNCLVPTNYPANPSLGRWVDRQRSQYKIFTAGKSTSLTPDRIKMLEDLDFQWKVRDDWEGRYSELVEFFNYHGHSLVPARYSPNPSLSKWVDTQRQQYKLHMQGKPSSMTKQRIDLLNEVNFQWRLIEDWMQRFRELEEYVKKHGDALVPQHYVENPSLGIWVRNQRTQFKLLKGGRTSMLSKDRIQLLESLNFEWNAYEAKWMACFVELGKYVRQHGFGSLPSYQENKSLRCWAEEQRKQYKKWFHSKEKGLEGELAKRCRLTTRRRELLDLLGFPWPVVYPCMCT